jgi:hypothetical protein
VKTNHASLVLAVGFAMLGVNSLGQSDVGLLPDLAFHFTCKDVAGDSLAGELGTFLHTSGFRSIDLAKIQAEHGLRMPHFHMEAIDPANHWVTISSSPRHPDAYGFALFSTPPTQHSLKLESSFVEFITMTLHCDAKDEARHENGLEALPLFQRQVARVEGLLQEADEMARKEHR